jgi:hypothetical protein
MALSKFEYNSFDVTPVASNAFAFNSTPNGLTTAAAGAMNLIKTTTASGVANVDLTHGSNDVVLDGTYDTYLFKLINIHVSAQCEFAVNFSTDGQSSAASKQTTTFNCYHQENGASTQFEYVAADDRANNVGDQQITAIDIGTQNDSGLCAEVFLFSPASTTFMKHFVVKSQYFSHQSTPYSNNVFVGGYVNTTSAVNSVRFLTSTGNFDGTIKMYGITK